MYVNDGKALLQAMCFFMQEKEKQDGDKIGFVQFPQCFEGVDEDDIYGTSMTAGLEVSFSWYFSFIFTRLNVYRCISLLGR